MGKAKNLHHRVADAREGKAPSVSAGRDMSLDENGGAGAVDLSDRRHIDQQVLPAGQAVEEHLPGLPGMVKIDRANDAGSGYRLIGQNEFFAISPKLISEGMDKKFLGTIFILGGCNTLSHPSIAESLIERGASLVVGWDNTVSSYDNDKAMLMFLRYTLADNFEVEESLEMIQETIIPEKMAWTANLIYYDSV